PEIPMPPFITAQCPHCGEKNVYDLTELTVTHPGARVFRAVHPPPELDRRREFAVTCTHCHRPFKITVTEKGGPQ
ncbi:MAG: hypothetical protein ACUVSH_11130, partial [Anaerolineae bacterium]